MMLVDELRQLPSSTAIKVLGLLDLPESKRREVEEEMVSIWLYEKGATKSPVSAGSMFCWFEHLRNMPPSLIEIQLQAVHSSGKKLDSSEKLVIRFTLLFCAGKIVPDKNTITESQLRVLLTILRNL